MKPVVILGAGITGLSAGWLLSNKNIPFIIVEKNPYVGGLARSFDWHGFKCDFAAHRLFTTDESVLHQFLNLVPMGRHIRRSKIYLDGHWMNDPLDVIELGMKLPIQDKIRTGTNYLFRPKNLDENNFEDFVLKRYGKGLYEVFFQPYTEKLFGIPGDEISVLWAQQKVRLSNPLDSFRENTKTKFQYFYYPLRGGYGAISNRLYEEISDQVKLNATVTGFEKSGGEITSVIINSDSIEERITAQAVISTLPLSMSLNLLDTDLQMPFQKVDAVFLLLDKPNMSDYHWIYFVDQEISINRLVEFKNLSPIETPANTTVVCAEVTKKIEDPIGKVIQDLETVGLIQRSDVLDTKNILERYAYPVYSLEYENIINTAQSVLKEYDNVYSIGRAAEFRHREADDNFAIANQTVNQISGKYFDQKIKIMEDIIQVGRETTSQIYAVLLAFNNYEDTHECIQSLIDSEFPDLKIVLVDNGSTDQTPEKTRNNFPEVQVIENQQNLGVPAGYNVGFKYALEKGAEYIFMLNNDTTIAKDMLGKLYEVAENEKDAGIIMPKILVYGTEDQIWSSGGRYRSFPPAILVTDKRAKQEQLPIRPLEYAPSCGLLIHRRAFEKAGLFDPGYFFLFDDWDFSERVRTHGLSIWFVRDAVMWHKVSRTTQGTRSKLYWFTWGASIARFYRRHGRPMWISLPAHAGYIILREFFIFQNWKYWSDFWGGFKEGLRKPLGKIPQYSIRSH